MPSSLNADNGVVSGTAGLKSSADNSGVLDLQTNGTTAISISASQVVTFANQPAYTGGTANGVLYLNASKVLTSGSALTFDGSQLDIPLGSAGTPSLSTPTDPNTGMFFPAADTIAFAEGGVEAMRLDASGNLLVGTTSASSKLTIGGSGANRMSFAGPSGTYFIGYDGATDTLGIASNTSIRFQTGAYVEAMRIDSSGRIAFSNNGTSSDRLINAAFSGATTSGANQFGFVLNPTYPNTVTSTLFNMYTGPNLTAGTTVTTVYGHYLEAINAPGSTVTNRYGLYQAGPSDNNVFAGNVGVNKGITFPATQVASANANTLDDYEEGTYTVAMSGSGGSITLDPSINTLKYTKTGNTVTIQGRFRIQSISSPTGALSVTLPFVNSSGNGGQSNYAAFLVITHDVDLVAGTITTFAETAGAITYATLFQQFDNAAWTAIGGSQLKGNGNEYIYMVGTYMTST